MNIQEEIIKEEKIIENAVKQSMFSKPWGKSLTGIFIILVLLMSFIFWRMNRGQLKTDNANIEIPIINLSSSSAGILENIEVNVGDKVLPNTKVAQVGNESVLSKVGGTIVSVNHQEGQFFSPGQTVVSMINPSEARVLVKIDENKGFSEIKSGQKVLFTVDAFGSKKFYGIVDEVSEISDESGVVFNISDKREVKKFTVKIKFDVSAYAELKDGMSAKVTIFTK